MNFVCETNFCIKISIRIGLCSSTHVQMFLSIDQNLCKINYSICYIILFLPCPVLFQFIFCCSSLLRCLYTLQPAPSTLQTIYYALYTTQYTLHTAHCTIQTEHSKLHTPNCTHQTEHSKLNTPN